MLSNMAGSYCSDFFDGLARIIPEGIKPVIGTGGQDSI